MSILFHDRFNSSSFYLKLSGLQCPWTTHYCTLVCSQNLLVHFELFEICSFREFFIFSRNSFLQHGLWYFIDNTSFISIPTRKKTYILVFLFLKGKVDEVEGWWALRYMSKNMLKKRHSRLYSVWVTKLVFVSEELATNVFTNLKWAFQKAVSSRSPLWVFSCDCSCFPSYGCSLMPSVSLWSQSCFLFTTFCLSRCSSQHFQLFGYSYMIFFH